MRWSDLATWKPEDVAAYAASNPHDFLLRECAEGGLDNWGSHRYGGKMEDIERPLLRFFSIPGIRKRRVRVTVTKFILGTHYHVRIEEEDDALWDAKERTWTKPWRDHDLDGLSFDNQYTKTRFIEPYVDRIVKAHFPSATHYIDRETLGATTYGRDGD